MLFEAPVYAGTLANGGLHVGTDVNRLLHWPTAAVGSGGRPICFYHGLYPADPLCRRDDLYVLLLGRIYWACVGNRYSRAVYRPGLASRLVAKALFSVVR